MMMTTTTTTMMIGMIMVYIWYMVRAREGEDIHTWVVYIRYNNTYQGGGARRHDGGDQGVDVLKTGGLDPQPFRGDAVKCGVVQHDHGVRIECQSFQSQETVVGLDDDVRHLVLVGEDTVRLDEFLGVPFV